MSKTAKLIGIGFIAISVLVSYGYLWLLKHLFDLPLWNLGGVVSVGLMILLALVVGIIDIILWVIGFGFIFVKD